MSLCVCVENTGTVGGKKHQVSKVGSITAFKHSLISANVTACAHIYTHTHTIGIWEEITAVTKQTADPVTRTDPQRSNL